MTGVGKHLKNINLGEGAGFEFECQNFISYCALLAVSDARYIFCITFYPSLILIINQLTIPHKDFKSINYFTLAKH